MAKHRSRLWRDDKDICDCGIKQQKEIKYHVSNTYGEDFAEWEAMAITFLHLNNLFKVNDQN